MWASGSKGSNKALSFFFFYVKKQSPDFVSLRSDLYKRAFTHDPMTFGYEDMTKPNSGWRPSWILPIRSGFGALKIKFSILVYIIIMCHVLFLLTHLPNNTPSDWTIICVFHALHMDANQI